jgi:hypothetical protein
MDVSHLSHVGTCTRLEQYGLLSFQFRLFYRLTVLSHLLTTLSFCFDAYVDHLGQKVNSQLYAIKNLFFLSTSVRTQFFKSFLLPHFDYCISIGMYFMMSLYHYLMMSNAYNNCLYHLFKIDLRQKTFDQQLDILKPFNLLPYKVQLFYRVSLFSYKILNGQILNKFKNHLTPYID